MANGTNISFRTSQSFSLGAGPAVAGLAHTLNFQAARSILAGQLTLTPSNELTASGPVAGGFARVGGPGNVTAISIQGQSLMTSNGTVPLRAFSVYAPDQSHAFIGSGVPANGVLQVVTAGCTGLPTLNGGIFCDPWDDAQMGGPPPSPDSPENQGSLNYVFGLGQITIPPLGVGTLISTALRPQMLGFTYLQAMDDGTVAAANVNSFLNEALMDVQSIQINATEQLSSAVGASVPFSQFTLGSADADQRVLGQFIPMNGTLSIRISNPTANQVIVSGCVFCLHA